MVSSGNHLSTTGAPSGAVANHAPLSDTPASARARSSKPSLRSRARFTSPEAARTPPSPSRTRASAAAPRRLFTSKVLSDQPLEVGRWATEGLEPLGHDLQYVRALAHPRVASLARMPGPEAARPSPQTLEPPGVCTGGVRCLTCSNPRSGALGLAPRAELLRILMLPDFGRVAFPLNQG